MFHEMFHQRRSEQSEVVICSDFPSKVKVDPNQQNHHNLTDPMLFSIHFQPIVNKPEM